MTREQCKAKIRAINYDIIDLDHKLSIAEDELADAQQRFNDIEEELAEAQAYMFELVNTRRFDDDEG